VIDGVEYDVLSEYSCEGQCHERVIRIRPKRKQWRSVSELEYIRYEPHETIMGEEKFVFRVKDRRVVK
jgi:hypothetical protein